jgi:hypothetical protein
MQKTTFQALMEEIEPHFPIGHSVNGKNVIPAERVLIFLMYLSGDKTVWDQMYVIHFPLLCHIMLRDLLTQKFVHKFLVTDFGYPRACVFRNT